MTATAVIALLATQASGAAPGATGSANSRAQSVSARVSAPVNLGPTVSGWLVAPRRSIASGGSGAKKCPSARKAVRFYQRRWNEHRIKMGAGLARAGSAPETGRRTSCPRVRYLAALWKRKAYAMRVRYERWFTALYEKWKCIHEHEGAWDDPNPPHYGGLQFDDDFQRTYGPEFFRRWGDAGNWPVWAQLIAAERAYRTRGFGPWPNTRRMCGI